MTEILLPFPVPFIPFSRGACLENDYIIVHRFASRGPPSYEPGPACGSRALYCSRSAKHGVIAFFCRGDRLPASKSPSSASSGFVEENETQELSRSIPGAASRSTQIKSERREVLVCCLPQVLGLANEYILEVLLRSRISEVE